jgi:superfamily I DNA/RNA helicase
MLNLKRWHIDRQHTLQPRSQGYLILDTLRRFMQSADADLAAQHVPRHGSLLAAPEATMRAVTEFALHGAKHVWARMRNENDSMPLGHDGYLKLWALSDPVIAADFILLDEAQDTNPIVLDVLRKQPAQMIYVGDKYQQIYEWRGAVNAMEKIGTDSATYLTTSFRFGQAIAEAASKLLVLLGEQRSIKGNPIISSRIGHVAPQTILARTNASTIAAIIESLDTGRSPHLVGGTDEVMEMLRGVQDLKEARQSTVPDFFGFDKWEQVVEFAKSGEGDHLLSFVNLVEGRGERQLMWALNRTVDEERSDLIISTAHKAKGREWSTVRLMDDFLRSQPKKQKSDNAQYANGHDPAEVRLFYVALTRAKEAIEVPQSVLSLIG